MNGFQSDRPMHPARGDGRGIDVSLATLSGEGAGQRAGSQPDHVPIAPWQGMPGGDTGAVTYYGRPLLKPSVWSIDIPIYYFCGGAAGAALALGAAIQVVCRDRRSAHELRRLSATCHWIGIVGSTAGAAFLIHDLGRPERFLYMMRVFRPTSPMNMGVWILSGAAPAAVAAGLFVNRGGWVGRLGEAAGYASGIFGAGLAGYTGVLVSNSAIPVWQDARRWMPPLFVASSASAAAGVLQLFAFEPRASRMARVFGASGRVAELVAARLVRTSSASETQATA
jgi:formate-dependent nitrite reductase membrane component NrfD